MEAIRMQDIRASILRRLAHSTHVSSESHAIDDELDH